MNDAAVRPGARSVVIRALLLGTFALAAIATAIVHRQDRLERIPVEAFVRDFTIETRLPELASAVRYAPDSAEAASVATGAALQDALGGTLLQDLDQEKRLLWLESLGRIDAELEAASIFARDAIRRRPGWPLQASWFGLAQYASARRSLTLDDAAPRWLVPMRVAHEAAPGDMAIVTAAASAALEAWPVLDSRWRVYASPLWRGALSDERFAAEAYASLSDTIGFDAAIAALPAQPAALKAALLAHAEVSDTRNAATLYERWAVAERAGRKRDLAKLENRARLHDVVGLRSGARAWVRAHSVFDFDDAAGRREAGRVLELWPPDLGAWHSDPRAEMVRFFLERQGSGVEGEAVQRAAESLSEIPVPDLALARLLAGDMYEAGTLASHGDSTGFEWTAFHVESARLLLARGDAAAAAEALGRVAPAARDECDVTIVRAAIERARGQIEVLDPRIILHDYPAAMWSRNRVAICIDPASAFTDFRVSFETGTPALLSFGFDGARSGARFVPTGAHQLDVPVEHRTARHIVTIDTLSGGPVTVRGGALR